MLFSLQLSLSFWDTINSYWEGIFGISKSESPITHIFFKCKIPNKLSHIETLIISISISTTELHKVCYYYYIYFLKQKGKDFFISRLKKLINNRQLNKKLNKYFNTKGILTGFSAGLVATLTITFALKI